MTDRSESEPIADASLPIERSQPRFRKVIITLCVLIFLPPLVIATLFLVRPWLRSMEAKRLDHYDDWRLGMTLAESRPLIEHLSNGDVDWELKPNALDSEGYAHRYTATLPNPDEEWTEIEVIFFMPLGDAPTETPAPDHPDDAAILEYITFSRPTVTDIEFQDLKVRMEQRYGPGNEFKPGVVVWPDDDFLFSHIDLFLRAHNGPGMSLRQHQRSNVDLPDTERTCLNFYISRS